MTTEFPNETVLRQYLLGNLPEHEWEEIEQRLLREDDFASNIEVIEDEIIEDYLQGTLSAEERRAVETHFLCPPERRRKLWFARLLRSHLQGQQQPAVKPIAIPWFRRPAFSWAMSLATATLLITVVGLGVYTANLSRSLQHEKDDRQMAQASLEQERKRVEKVQAQLLLLQQQTGGEQGAVAANQSVVLNLMELERGQSGVPELNQNVEVHIALVHGVRSSYEATLQSASISKIWSKAGLKPTGYQLVFTIPRNILPPGEYSLIIQGEGDTHKSTYPFVVR
jgi:hypothetical protein